MTPTLSHCYVPFLRWQHAPKASAQLSPLRALAFTPSPCGVEAAGISGRPEVCCGRLSKLTMAGTSRGAAAPGPWRPMLQRPKDR